MYRMYRTHPAKNHARHRIAGDQLEVRIVQRFVHPYFYRLGDSPYRNLAVTPRLARMRFLARWLRRLSAHGIEPNEQILSRLLACWRGSLQLEYGRQTMPIQSTFPGLRERVLVAVARRVH